MSATMGQIKIKQLQIVTIRGDRVLGVVYTAKPETYDTFLPEVKKAIESFEFTD